MSQFIDIFAGAGGLSLGLLKAGWTGLFAIEKSHMAFETLKYNLIDKKGGPHFEWPDWLPPSAIGIEAFLEMYKGQLEALRGLPLLAGGPPCQGFSLAGRRRVNDERNRLFEHYLEFVKEVQPKMLLIENVVGFTTTFRKTERGVGGVVVDIDQELFNAAEELSERLDKMGYTSFISPSKIVIATDFGVPQRRPRYIHIAILKTFLEAAVSYHCSPFETLKELLASFLHERGLSNDDVTIKEAVADLEQSPERLVRCIEPRFTRFNQGKYGPIDNPYQRLMRRDLQGREILEGQVADSHRFPNHSARIAARFQEIISSCRPGIHLNDAERSKLAIGKHCIAGLAGNEPCHTLTSLPDDLVHYSEPRILTVREYARIQSFPDGFEFKSNYTTGGKRRRVEVPRYTQVANAVPPLMAEAFGLALLQVYTTLLQASLLRETIIV